MNILKLRQEILLNLCIAKFGTHNMGDDNEQNNTTNTYKVPEPSG